MMHSNARTSSSSTPHSDTDSPCAPGSGDTQMEKGRRHGEYGDVNDEDTKRSSTGFDSHLELQQCLIE